MLRAAIGSPGTDLTAPGPIGGTTPAAGAFTSLKSNGGNVVYVLSQTGLPMIIPSSGVLTPGTSAQLALTTALPATFSGGCYMFFPANALSGSSAAGFYYVVMSSTTVGTIYTTVYATGTPAIPANPVGFTVTTAIYAQSTSAQIAVTVALPGNSLGVGGAIDWYTHGSNSNSANNKVCAVKYSSFTIGTRTETTTTSTRIAGNMVNSGATSIQTATYTPAGSSADTLVRGAIDSTASQNLTINLTNANVLDYVILESYSFKITPN